MEVSPHTVVILKHAPDPSDLGFAAKPMCLSQRQPQIFDE